MMNVIENTDNHAEQVDGAAAEQNRPEPPANFPIIAAPKPPERPRNQLFVKIALCAIALVVGLSGVAYWKRGAIQGLLYLIPPYSSGIAFVSLGIIGAFYKDNYRYRAAKWAAVIIMVVFGFLMGLNTYQERVAKAQEKADRAKDKIENAKTNDGIVKSVDHISGELKDFKDKVKPDEISARMTGLRSTMEKVLHPQQATILFTFSPFPDPAVLGEPIIPARDVTLPLNPDGSVHLRFAFANNTDVHADGLQVTLIICIGCKFAKEPDGFRRLAGSRETERNYLYGDAPAHGAYPELAADIIPPLNAPAFSIRTGYRCKTCILEANGTLGRVHIQRN